MRTVLLILTLIAGFDTCAQSTLSFNLIREAIDQNNIELLEHIFEEDNENQEITFDVYSFLYRHYTVEEFKYLEFLYEKEYINLYSKIGVDGTIVHLACHYKKLISSARCYLTPKIEK